MKKYLLSLWGLLLMQGLLGIPASRACDICGCGAGNYYFGLMPMFHKNFVGLRYQYAGFESHLSPTAYSDLFRSRETFRSTELWGRFYLGEHTQMTVFLPYLHNTQESLEGQKDLQGLGDALLMVNYRLWQTRPKSDTVSPRIKQSLFVGAGSKLPTGRSRFSEAPGQVANPNFQLGTGSIDFLAGLFYNVRAGRWGFNADWSFKFNTANAAGYQFGRRQTANLQVFYIQKIGNIGLMPSAGLYFEQSLRDRDRGFDNQNTGGWAQAASAGLDIYYKKINLGLQYRKMTGQELAGGGIKALSRFNTQINFLF